MEDKKNISTFQLITLITVSAIMHQYTYLPILHTVPVNQDSWIILISFIPYVIILCLPILFLLSKFKGIPFFDIMTLILGKTGGRIVTFILCLFFCFCSAACLALSVVFLQTYILPLTPSFVIVLSILIPVAYICYKGLKTISLISVFVFLGIIFITISFFLFGFTQLNFHVFQPVMADSTFLEVNLGGFITAARFSDILILFAAAYRLKDQAKTNKVFFFTVILYIFLTLVMLTSVLTMLGLDYGLQSFNPFYLFARQVEIYTFLQRSEVFVMVSWLLGAIIKVTIYHYLMAYYLSKTFNIKNYKNVIIPVVIFSFLLIYIFGLDTSYVIEILRSDAIFPWVVLFFILVIPLFIMIVYLFRRKKIDKKKQLLAQN